MSQAIKSINPGLGTLESQAPSVGGKGSLAGYLPALLPIIGAGLVTAARVRLGASAVPSDGTLIVLALLSYIIAAAGLVTNFWAPIPFLQRMGVWVGSAGVFFNLSSWLVRWVAAGDRENWIRMTSQITGE